MHSYQPPFSTLGTICLTFVSATTFIAILTAILLRIGDLGVNNSTVRIPVIGVRKEWMSWPRATFRSVFRSQDLALEGYSKVITVSSFALMLDHFILLRVFQSQPTNDV